MRHIQVEEGLRVRFPGRSADFDDGVEIGVVSALMAIGNPFTRPISASNLDQVRILADRFGYHASAGPLDNGAAIVAFGRGRQRPSLRLVHAAPPEQAKAPPTAGQVRPPTAVRLAVGAP